ncbi:MAG TPA: class I SAM-dependent methyltransferase [Solirubrobacteraceae bacterium]|jgi:SAM-dependent methyltransferase|nr:class I SAM-dependent methyltransferase [Solirubrobacteraceae bacterium]
MRQPLTERVRDSLRLRALDVRDRVSGRADRLVPPRRLDYAGHSDFVATGEEFLAYFVELGGLQPHHAVLDVGCGMGRMARPLAGFLSSEGSYDGFDVNRDGIGWCRRRYARHDNFRFQVADLYNRRYNPHGAHAAGDYRFPYDDERFDLAILTSVLTHLLEREADHYLAETARVLKPGGRMLATFFLLNEESRGLIADGSAALAFLDPDDHVSVLDADLPEEAVAYDEEWLGERLAEHGLRPEATRYGSWCGRPDFASFQDLIVATSA